MSPLNCLFLFRFMLTDNVRKTGCLYKQKKSLQEPSAFGLHKLMKCIMRMVKLFYARCCVEDKIKRYIRANEKEIIIPSSRNVAKCVSMQKIWYNPLKNLQNKMEKLFQSFRIATSHFPTEYRLISLKAYLFDKIFKTSWPQLFGEAV